MTRQTEEDDLLLTLLLRLERLTDSGCDGMTALWSRNDSLGAGKEHTCLERLQLWNVHTVQITVLEQLRDDHTGTMITQTTSMNVGRFEVMTQGEHRQQRSVASLITEVIFELTSCQLRTALWLSCNKLGVLLTTQVMTHEWESQSAEVTSATEAGNHLVRIFASHLHLLFCLQSDDSLMQSHMIEHRTQCVLTARSGSSQLDSLADGSTE